MREALFRLLFGLTIEEYVNPPRVTGISFLDHIFVIGILRMSILCGFGFSLFALATRVLGKGDPLGLFMLVFATFAGLVMAVIVAVMLGAVRLLVWIIGLIRKKRGGI